MTPYASLIKLPLPELMLKADRLRRKYQPETLDLCTILNAKSGLCAEDCKFCAQSSRHKTEVPVYPLKPLEEIIEAAKTARENGAERFGIVTSGNKLTQQDLDTILQATRIITRELGIKVCGSLGALPEKDLIQLKSAGMHRYHHNIETSREYYKTIVGTHDFEERISTIRAAKKAGMEVCSGGIIGMGESWEDRIRMALILKKLKVDSVPVNILVPIPGTPMEKITPISSEDILKTLCLFRIILKDKVIKIAAGRESRLKDFQGMGFLSGANGMLIGGYLTTRGRSVEEDQAFLREVKTLWKSGNC